MADPLSLLRHHNMAGKTIEEDGKNIMFGEFSWPKTVKTNFRIVGWDGKDSSEWEYYTLESLLYFLKNTTKTHPQYVRDAASIGIPVVSRPDRRALLAYLRGEKDAAVPNSIDKSARLEMPATHVKRPADGPAIEAPIQAKKLRMDMAGATPLATPQAQATPAQQDAAAPGDAQQQLKDRFVAKLNEPRGEKLPINRVDIKDLSADLTTDKIAEIRAKLLSNRRTRIKPGEDDDVRTAAIGMGDMEVSRESSAIFKRERQWRTRTTILQSTGKNFSKTITAILNSVKMREEGRKPGQPGMAPPPRPGQPYPGGQPGGTRGGPLPGQPRPHPGMANALSQPRQLPNYNRYDQERFRKEDTHGFNIDTVGTFSGMTLKSVTEGNRNNQANQARKPAVAPNPAAQRPSQPAPGSQSGGGVGGGGSGGGKRVSRTPIIIIPAAPKSLITMYNAKDILQDLRFMSTEDKKSAGARRENELLIQRRKEGGLTVPYRVIDNPAKLTNAEWDRVVAVFVMGQAWQFKGWPWDGNPTQIFAKVKAFHLKWDESLTEKNISGWAVNIIQLSRNLRHLDRAKIMRFWEQLDQYMVNNKPHLRY